MAGVEGWDDVVALAVNDEDGREGGGSPIGVGHGPAPDDGGGQGRAEGGQGESDRSPEGVAQKRRAGLGED